MTWDAVEGAVRAAFKTVAAEGDGGRVFVPADALDLVAILRRHAEPGDGESDELGEYLDDDVVDVRGVLGSHWPIEPVLGFEWASMGPMVWFSTLDMLRLDEEIALVGLNHEEQEYVLFAAVEGGRAGWSLLLPHLCEGNGSRYRVDLFGSLPSQTENYRPDLLPQEVVRDGYSRWLDSADDGWWMFQESVIKFAAGAAHSSPVERVMAQAQVDFYFLDTPRVPNDEFDQNRRDVLLDLYLTHCCAEAPRTVRD